MCRQRLTLGEHGAGGFFMKDLWIRFIWGFDGELKESLRLMEKLERSYADISSREGGLCHEETTPEDENETPQIKETYAEDSGTSPESPIQVVNYILPSYAISVPVQPVS
jgi:hypothetical protein